MAKLTQTFEQVQSDLNKVEGITVTASTSSSTVANKLSVGGTTYGLFWTGTQEQYDAITTKDANTLYVIVG